MSTNVTLADRLLEIRKKRNLTQTQLAGELGITRVSLGNYESGKRRPDGDIIVEMCKRLNVSADYLLGITDTEKQEYAEIASTTGLNETSIAYLNSTNSKFREFINLLFREQPVDYDFTYPLEENDPYFDVEDAYKKHLEAEEFEREINEKHILDIIADEWAEKEFSVSKCITERSLEEEQEYLEQAEFYATMPAPTEEDLIREEKWREEYFNYQCVEGKKSKLLNAIYEYITYQNGCRLESMYRSEELTDERSINIGIGKDKIVKFPSAESDELFEFMLMQKVIDALKKFKEAYKDNS